MEAFQDFEEKMTCPFDVAHFIRKSKMANHLVKCQKNYPNAEMVTCDFNATHRIPKPMLRYHHETCCDRRKVESKIIVQEDEEVAFPIPKIKDDNEEVWEDDHPGYDPAAYCARNNVIRHLDVESQSKKRNFRVEERLRLNQFKTANTDRRPNAEPERTMTQRSPAAAFLNRMNTRESRPGPSVSLEEDAPQISLIERINRGQKKTYEPNY